MSAVNPEWLTYDQWLDKDMQVQKGQRATWFEGVPKFNMSQVEPVQDFHPEAATDWDWYKD